MLLCIKGDCVIVCYGLDIIQKNPVYFCYFQKYGKVYNEATVVSVEFNLVKYITNKHLQVRVRVYSDKKKNSSGQTILYYSPQTKSLCSFGNHEP